MQTSFSNIEQKTQSLFTFNPRGAVKPQPGTKAVAGQKTVM
jgi:hypothetical protein